MTECITYTTREGDRWDLIAWHAYGDAYAYEAIIAANPLVPITPILPAGLTLYVPVRPAPALGGLPPWRSSS